MRVGFKEIKYVINGAATTFSNKEHKNYDERLLLSERQFWCNFMYPPSYYSLGHEQEYFFYLTFLNFMTLFPRRGACIFCNKQKIQLTELI